MNFRITYVYHGDTKEYQIFMNGIEVHRTKDQFSRDMFIAELKARIMILEESFVNGMKKNNPMVGIIELK